MLESLYAALITFGTFYTFPYPPSLIPLPTENVRPVRATPRPEAPPKRGHPARAPVGEPRSEVIGDHPTHAQLSEIVNWLASNFDLPAIHDHPSFEFANPTALARIRYKGFCRMNAVTLSAIRRHKRFSSLRSLPSTMIRRRPSFSPTAGPVQLLRNYRSWCMRWCITCRTSVASNTNVQPRVKSPLISRKTSGSGVLEKSWKKNSGSTCSRSSSSLHAPIEPMHALSHA
jgi:hypothetical protein